MKMNQQSLFKLSHELNAGLLDFGTVVGMASMRLEV
jgi:hypothetical protein